MYVYTLLLIMSKKFDDSHWSGSLVLNKSSFEGFSLCAPVLKQIKKITKVQISI